MTAKGFPGNKGARQRRTKSAVPIRRIKSRSLLGDLASENQIHVVARGRSYWCVLYNRQRCRCCAGVLSEFRGPRHARPAHTVELCRRAQRHSDTGYPTRLSEAARYSATRIAYALLG